MHDDGRGLVASWRELREEYTQRIRASERRAEEAEENVRRLQSQVETTGLELESMRTRLKETEARLEARERGESAAKEKTVSLARRLQALHSKAKVRVSRAESQVQALKASLLSWMGRAKAAESRLAQAQDRIETLTAALAALESEWTAALSALPSIQNDDVRVREEEWEGDREEVLYNALVRAGEEVAELRSRTVWKEVSSTQTLAAASALKEAVLDAASEKARLEGEVAALKQEVEAVRESARVDIELATYPYRQYVAQMEEEVERGRAKVDETQAGGARMAAALDEAKRTIAGQRLAMAFLRKRVNRVEPGGGVGE